MRFHHEVTGDGRFTIQLDEEAFQLLRSGISNELYRTEESLKRGFDSGRAPTLRMFKRRMEGAWSEHHRRSQISPVEVGL